MSDETSRTDQPDEAGSNEAGSNEAASNDSGGEDVRAAASSGSDAGAETQASAGSVSPAPAAPERKARSPLERIVVWGLIVALLVVVGLEYRARSGYESSLARLQEAIQEDDRNVDAQPLRLERVGSMISGSPKGGQLEQSGGRRFVSYAWKGLIKEYGKITLELESGEEPNPMVLGLATSGAEPDPVVGARTMSYVEGGEAPRGDPADGDDAPDAGDAADTPDASDAAGDDDAGEGRGGRRGGRRSRGEAPPAGDEPSEQPEPKADEAPAAADEAKSDDGEAKSEDAAEAADEEKKDDAETQADDATADDDDSL